MIKKLKETKNNSRIGTKLNIYGNGRSFNNVLNKTFKRPKNISTKK